MNTITTENLIASPRTAPRNNGFRFEVADVTGTHFLDASDIRRDIPAGAVAMALAARMELPQGPWALRDDRTGNYLDDQRAIGEQIESESNARLTLTPKSHLG